jgi:hypothetical protein
MAPRPSTVQARRHPGWRGARLWLIVVVGSVSGLPLAACSGDGGAANAEVDGRALATRTTEVDSVKVSVAPRQVSTRAAVFAITLDTHSGDLGVDLRKAATLTVGGNDWPIATFDGDGPGGHHREGALRFRASGPPTGEMRLTIGGIGEPAEFSWNLGQGSAS